MVRRPARQVALSLALGGVHAAGLFALDQRLAYPVPAFGRGPLEAAWFVSGATALLAVPLLASLRYRLLAPVAFAVLGAVLAIQGALVGPEPSFSTLGGYTVVEGTLVLRNYVQGWYCWLFAYLLAGVLEYALRRDMPWLRDPAGRIAALEVTDPVRAARVAAVVGAAHLAAVVLLAAEYGYFAPDSSFADPLVLVWALPGAAVLGAVPAYLLARHRLVAPLAVFTWLFYRTAQVQFLPLPDDSLPVYLLGWPVFAGLFAAVALAERFARRLLTTYWPGPTGVS